MRSIGLPCKNAALMSIVLTAHFRLDAIAKAIFRVSRMHVGESVLSSSLHSSKPRATSLALVDITPLTIFGVITHLTDIVSCPESSTSSKTFSLIQLLYSACFAAEV